VQIATTVVAQDLSPDVLAQLKDEGLIQTQNEMHSLNTSTPNQIGYSKVSAGCDSLETSYLAGNGQSGVMFYVVASKALTIEYFYSNLSVTTSDMNLYYKSGSFTGFETDSLAWTFLGTTNVAPTTTNVPVFIPISINLAMNVGDTLAFYLLVWELLLLQEQFGIQMELP
jgi:hypothetical protein